jgi:hypothetical protein
MNRTALLLTSALVAVGVSATGNAATKNFPAGKSPTAVKGFTGNHQPKSKSGGATVLSTSSVYGTAVTGFDTVGTQTVTVGKKGGTLAMSAMSQYCAFDGEYGQHQMSLVTEVDGTYVDGGPYAGATQNSAVCNLPSWQGFYAVGAGSHTVTFTDYVDTGSVYIARSTERTDVVK